MGLLDGKVALVTGAGRGIGRGHARLLAAEGAKVVVNDLDNTPEPGTTSLGQSVVDEIAAAGGDAVLDTGDVSSWDGAGAVVQHAIDAYGRLDVLVNNAGVLRDALSFTIDEDQWDAVIDVHMKGHMATCHHATKYWRDRAKAGDEVTGRIINTASESGLFGLAAQVNYVAAKSGIISMTIAIAREMKKYGVTANVICPRALTRMTSSVPGAEEFMAGPDWDPDNIAPMVVFLASDDAADVSGQVFVVWGPRVHLMQIWQPVFTLDRGEGRWTPQELIERKDEIFGEGRRRKIPPAGFGL